MNHVHAAKNLGTNLAVFLDMFQGLEPELVQWKPNPEKWNLLEVLCHLVDEEKEDFRYRVEHVLDHSDQPMPPIDPVGWVKSRNYAGQDLHLKLEEFTHERTKSVAWLYSLEDRDWSKVYIHPKQGEMTAALFLANWLAHDLLHFRQITRIKYEYLKLNAGVPLDYAGDW
jgi:hypothetical protein